jgi:chorismate mutase-like protein
VKGGGAISLRIHVALLLTVVTCCAAANPLAGLESAIAARLLLMDDVARYKWNHELAIADPEREAALLDRATAEAVAIGLPEAYARRVLAAQIDASRALQTELVTTWRQRQQPVFVAVPDLAGVQRPAIDAATLRLLEALHTSLCALADDEARAALKTTPPAFDHHLSVWTIATDALWPVPDDACPRRIRAPG